MDAFLVPQPADTDSDADSDVTECPGSEQDEDEDVTKHVPDVDAQKRAWSTYRCNHRITQKKQRVTEEQPGGATEHTDDSEDVCDEAFPQCITSNEAAATVADATGKKQMFTKNLAHRDDWLHRGIMLRDMDYYHYAHYVERVEMPGSGSAQTKNAMAFIIFSMRTIRLQRPMCKYC